jgi:hypothetical protein
MNRRQLMMLSGAAVATGSGLIQAAQPASGSGASQRASYKALLKLGRPKSSYKIPKTDSKKTKYIGSLSAALALSSAQQQQADTIFSGALSTRAALRGSLKTARQNLREAVRSNDVSAIEQMSATVASIKAQLVSAGANAHAAFRRILSPDQLARLTQFQT